jgi:hypothetical protein
MAGKCSLVHFHGERMYVLLRVPRVVRTSDSVRHSPRTWTRSGTDTPSPRTYQVRGLYAKHVTIILQQTRLQRAAVGSGAGARHTRSLIGVVVSEAPQDRTKRSGHLRAYVQHLKWARSRALTRNYLSLSPKP